MKKILIVVTIFVVITFFIIGNKQDKSNSNLVSSEHNDEYRAIFISYLELDTYIKGKDDNTSKNNIINILDNMKDNNFNMAILHVRPFSDAIYESDIFPYSKYILSNENEIPNYDILSFFIEQAHFRNIEVHAWINPYRIRNTTDISDISIDNPIYKHLNTNHIKIIEGKGVYYNPASSVVQNLIVSGVEEIVINYDIDGIHFDDYFYPDDTIDLENYQEYINNGGTLNLSDYRLNNTSTLIKKVYDKIKTIDSKVSFGISPEGNINNNYDSNYLDVKKILSTKGYIDYIMPQIYFGFLNEYMPFIETINLWNSLINEKSIKIIPALAFYKTGKLDNYAGKGKEEWLQYNDIIKKQVLTSRALNNYGGFSLFRYDYIFGNNLSEISIKEKVNLLEIIS